MFEVQDLPRVVVLRPDCSVLTADAVEEICKLGPDCYRNWQEGAELIDRNFMMNEEFDEGKMRSMTDPIRCVKYKVEDRKMKKKKKKKDGVSVEEEDEDGDEDGNDGGGGWG
ncbi:nucleoredoxin-like protein 1 [Sinocyclocheilus grahami]|uniref:nucleoredoxin-like protein 1 n=1 Tax=Sinocyclocheilus grahami TaxID=75366 RepID=UPI0007AD6088|nr:PREDICTED: nucleoredoxin-like protein 1 [Sinocyclocheilus grahami]XP_016112668.1 PREDICTED: nucleoredoxin-like protein 1 [Sinocyclocheilus grahami]